MCENERKKEEWGMLFVSMLFIYNGVEKMATWVYLVLLLLVYMLFDSSYNGRKEGYIGLYYSTVVVL
jgi:hypothetical protein